MLFIVFKQEPPEFVI